jgi:hypothetical protein
MGGQRWNIFHVLSLEDAQGLELHAGRGQTMGQSKDRQRQQEVAKASKKSASSRIYTKTDICRYYRLQPRVGPHEQSDRIIAGLVV